jgi:lauroyl/myristoyl acyltransferase
MRRRFLVFLFLAGAVLWLLRPRRKNGDYRAARFYRTLYTTGGFEWAIRARRLTGRRLSRVLARVFGAGYALTHPATVRAIRHNIALLDPAKATRRAAFEVCMQQGLNFREYADLAVDDPSRVVERFGELRGIEHIEAARADGKGVILVTGHLGFFELGGLAMAQWGYPFTTLTLPEPSEPLTRWRADFRARWGVETRVVGTDAFSAVEVARLLGEGGLVALLADRPFDTNRVDVRLPHGTIPFASAPVMLSLLSGAPLVAVGTTRRSDGRFRIMAAEPLRPHWLPEGKRETIEYFTRRLALEGLVPMFVESPEQWHHFAPLDQ